MNKMNLAVLSLLFASAVARAQITNPAPYCPATYDDGAIPIPHYISNVTLGTLNKTSGNMQQAAPHYIYYNTTAAPSLTKGSNYNLSVMHDGGATIHWVAVYIDFNRNNSFDDAGERVLQQKPGMVTNPSTGTITIPATAVAGDARMRVMVFEDDPFTGGAPGNAKPCTAHAGGFFDWGETEDYNVKIVAGTTGIDAIGAGDISRLIYPNPAGDRINLDETLQKADIVIYDINGRLVADHKRVAQSIDVSRLKAGSYFLRITDGTHTFSKMMTIAR